MMPPPPSYPAYSQYPQANYPAPTASVGQFSVAYQQQLERMQAQHQHNTQKHLSTQSDATAYPNTYSPASYYHYAGYPASTAIDNRPGQKMTPSSPQQQHQQQYSPQAQGGYYPYAGYAYTPQSYSTNGNHGQEVAQHSRTQSPMKLPSLSQQQPAPSIVQKEGLKIAIKPQAPSIPRGRNTLASRMSLCSFRVVFSCLFYFMKLPLLFTLFAFLHSFFVYCFFFLFFLLPFPFFSLSLLCFVLLLAHC
jgi:hypothetical protein